MDLPSSSSVRNNVLNRHQAKLLGASNTFVLYAAAPDPGADVYCLPNFFMDVEVTIKIESEYCAHLVKIVAQLRIAHTQARSVWRWPRLM